MNMSSKPKAIHFGAGNIGRGFIGPLLAQSGYHVVFADVDKALIDTINKEHHYEVHILDSVAKESDKQFDVADFSGVLSNTDDIIREIADSNVKLITTAVGVAILDRIAPMVAKGLEARREGGGAMVNIIACENTIGATSQLGEKVQSALTSPEDRTYISQHVGFANCSVDRIIPPFEHDEQHSSLDVGVEGFYEWIVEGPSLKDPKPDINGMKLTSNLLAYNERKLFTLNTGHAITAYLGFIKGHATIDVSIADPQVRSVVRGALEESGEALCRKHGFSKEEHEKYIDKIETRFKNPSVKDEVVRVGRQPRRKLGRKDRLLGPAYMCREYGISIQYLATGIAAAFWYHNEHDEESKELQKEVAEKGIEKVVAEVTGHDEGSEEHLMIIISYRDLEKWKNSPKL